MGDETRVDDLFGAWYARHERGEAEPFEAFCAAHPEIAGALRRRAAALDVVDTAFHPPPPDLPERIGPWRLLRVLGAGGMGTVHLAEAESRVPGVEPGTRVALKVIHPHLLERPGFHRRVLREGRIGREVNHANVVRTYDVDLLVAGGKPCQFLVMEYVEGRTLREFLEELDRVPEELCRHVAREILRGLTAIHAAGAVHRDLKPDNVLVTDAHVVKVMDLGVAALRDETIRLSQTGAFVGSIHYAAPEQFGSPREVDGRADLFSLGVLLYELASGVHPFDDEDVRVVMRRLLSEPPRRLGDANPQVSAFFEEVVHRLLAKSPEDRFASAAEVLAVLEEGERSAWWRDRARELRRSTQRPLRRIRVPRETAVYGRDDDLARLGELWRSAKEGRGRVLLLEGEAGIGKTRVVDEFVARLREAGEDLHFLFGSYPPGGAATTSGALSTAFREHLGAEGLEEVLAPLLTTTPILVPAFAALLRGEPAPPGSEPLTKESLQTVFVHALRALARERPVVLLVDDLHFAPEEGRALFASLSFAVPEHRVLLVGTARPGVPERWVAGIQRLEHAERRELRRLGVKDLVRLLRDTLRSERLAEELAGRIGVKSDGNPFFVFEILRGLREGQFLRQRPDGTWETTEILRDIEVPSSVLDLVNARVADLEEEDRDLLDVASCCGFEFDPTLVGEALALPRIPVLKRLARIEKKHRLVRSAGERFVFDHHQVQEALYRALPPGLAREYHTAVADALERRHGAAEKDPKELDGGLCVELCEHRLRGGGPQRASRYVREAVQHLSDHHAHERLLSIATDMLRAPAGVEQPDRVAILILVEQSLHAIGDRESQRKVLDELDPLVSSGPTTSERRTVGSCLARLHFVTGDFANAQKCLETQLSAAQASCDRSWEASLHNNLGNVAYSIDRLDEAVGHFERARTLAREEGAPKAEGNAACGLGNVLSRRGNPRAAVAQYMSFLGACQSLRDLAGEALAAMNLSIVTATTGDLERALAWAESATALFRQLGDRRGESHALVALGEVLADMGRLADARSAHVRAESILREIDDRPGRSIALLCLSQSLLQTGDRDAAGAALREAREAFVQMGHRRGIVMCALEQADHMNEDGDADRRAESLRFAREVAATIDDPALVATVGMALVDHYLDAGERALASDELPALMSCAESCGVVRIVDGVRYRAALLCSDGPAAAAADLLRRASGTRSPMLLSHLHRYWRATRDRAHLLEAKRLLEFMVEHAPPECRESMLANVRLHREIVADCRAEGIAFGEGVPASSEAAPA